MTALDTHGGPDAHAHAGEHGHHPRLAHHWADLEQQFEAGKLGMWLFIATEYLLFGGLFCAYAVYRFNHPEIFHYGSQFLDTKLGAINTVVLIVSSLTMALGVSMAQLGRTRALIALLVLTFLGGAGFMVIKYFEYSHKIHNHYMWGPNLYVPSPHDPPAPAHVEAAAPAVPEAPPPPAEGEFVITRSSVAPAAVGPSGLAPAALGEGGHDGAAAHEGEAEPAGAHAEEVHHEPNPRTDPNRPPNAHIFFGIYFCMTGLHGIHVLVGMAVIAWLIVRAARGEFGPDYYTPVDLGGLYWHVVDMIWIFLFPLLYLIG
jgi:cytochrome c oxidase subunit 3